MFFTHVQELFGNVTLKQVTKPLRWSNMATMPTLPETQESIKEEIRRQVRAAHPPAPRASPRSDPVGDCSAEDDGLLFLEHFPCVWSCVRHTRHGALKPELPIWHYFMPVKAEHHSGQSTGLEIKRPGFKFLLCS